MEPHYEFYGLSATVISGNRVRIWFGVRGKKIHFPIVPQVQRGILAITSKDEKRLIYISPNEIRRPYTTPEPDFGYWENEFELKNYNTEYKIVLSATWGNVLEGSFRTFPKNNVAKPFTFNFVSCSRADDAEHLDKCMASMVKQLKDSSSKFGKPAFCLHLGDNFYPGDNRLNEYESKLHHHQYVMRKGTNTAKAYARLSFLHTWDNHDHNNHKPFGGDNREDSRDREGMFRQIFWAPDRKGLYHSFNYNGCGFYMLDTRSFRSKKNKTLLGDKQWTWLEKQMKDNADNRIHFICSSSGVNKRTNTNDEEHEDKRWSRTWEPYPEDNKRLILLAKKHNIVILQGGTHFCRKMTYTVTSPLTSETAKLMLLDSSGFGRESDSEQYAREFWYSYLTIHVDPSDHKLYVRRINKDFEGNEEQRYKRKWKTVVGGPDQYFDDYYQLSDVQKADDDLEND